MPEVSRFLGIIIRMFFGDHAPPHFHAYYEDYEAVFSIESLEMISGKLPPRVKGLVIEWSSMHKEALMKNWISITNKKSPSFEKIKPLV
jgi:hypothetical protein